MENNKENNRDNEKNDSNYTDSSLKDNLYPNKLSKDEAEDEALWLRSMVDSGFSPDYEAADKTWSSDQLLEDTEQNAFFWKTVVDLRDKYVHEYQSNWLDEHRDELHEKYHYCFACKKELEPVFLDDYHFRKNCVQYGNALIVSLEGGYGMFVDPLPQEWLDEEDRLDPKEMIKKGMLSECTAIICDDCAHDLCEKVPWMNKLINDIP